MVLYSSLKVTDYSNAMSQAVENPSWRRVILKITKRLIWKLNLTHVPLITAVRALHVKRSSSFISNSMRERKNSFALTQCAKKPLLSKVISKHICAYIPERSHTTVQLQIAPSHLPIRACWMITWLSATKSQKWVNTAEYIHWRSRLKPGKVKKRINGSNNQTVKNKRAN